MKDNTILVKNNALSYFLKPDKKIIVFDHTLSKSYIISEASYQILISLDGSKTITEIIDQFNSYTKSEVLILLNHFLEIGLCSEGKVIDYPSAISDFFFNGRIIFWKEPEKLLILKSKTMRNIFRYIMILSFFLFCFEIKPLWNIVYNSNFILDMECIIPSFFIFCICLFFHEFSHATFAKSFNANVCEIGLQIQKNYPFFKFYTDIAGLTYIKKYFNKIEVHLAGIMSNFFLIQFCWIFIFSKSEIAVKIGVLIVIINVLCIFIDLIPIKGTDGYKIIDTLIKAKDK